MCVYLANKPRLNVGDYVGCNSSAYGNVSNIQPTRHFSVSCVDIICTDSMLPLWGGLDIAKMFVAQGIHGPVKVMQCMASKYHHTGCGKAYVKSQQYWVTFLSLNWWLWRVMYQPYAMAILCGVCNSQLHLWKCLMYLHSWSKTRHPWSGSLVHSVLNSTCVWNHAVQTLSQTHRFTLCKAQDFMVPSMWILVVYTHVLCCCKPKSCDNGSLGWKCLSLSVVDENHNCQRLVEQYQNLAVDEDHSLSVVADKIQDWLLHINHQHLQCFHKCCRIIICPQNIIIFQVSQQSLCSCLLWIKLLSFFILIILVTHQTFHFSWAQHRHYCNTSMTITVMLNDCHSLVSPVVARFDCTVSPADWLLFLLDLWSSHSFKTTQVNPTVTALAGLANLVVAGSL
jgi:hypothetical protein